MGIKNYLKYLPQEFSSEKSRNYDYVYLDCNYICHYLIYKCKSDVDFLNKIIVFWNYLASTIKIKKEIFLIFDGNYEGDKLSNPKYQTSMIRAKAKSKQISNDYDKQLIGPGTKILNTFKDYLLNTVERYKKINKLKFKITLNLDDINGEADIKILNEIFNSNQNNICICSKDTDMILISQSLSIKKMINIDILSNLRPIKFISVDKFKSFGLDYVLIVLLLGNDYLPKISNTSYESIIKMYNKYIKFNEPIILNDKININNLVNYIGHLIGNLNKKIKFKLSNINLHRFNIYFNNIQWCLGYYKVITSNNNFIQELTLNDTKIKLKNVINIYNFINFVYDE